MKFSAFFFDLDETLYPAECGLQQQVNERIREYCLKTVPMDPEKVADFRDDLFQRYGGTLPGLALEYGADLYDALDFCHQVNVEQIIRPNPELGAALRSLRVKKYILTSSVRFYASRVLRALEIEDCFEGMIDVLDVFPHGKPASEAFSFALQATNQKKVSTCAFFDDQARNISAAHQLGFYTVQVGSAAVSPDADAHISHAQDLLTIPEFKELWV